MVSRIHELAWPLLIWLPTVQLAGRILLIFLFLGYVLNVRDTERFMMYTI